MQAKASSWCVVAVDREASIAVGGVSLKKYLDLHAARVRERGSSHMVREHSKVAGTGNASKPQPIVGDVRLHPNEVRILTPRPEEMREIIPRRLYMRHWFGTKVSVAAFRLLSEEGQQPITPAFHAHGTEVGIQLRGGGWIEDRKGRRYSFREGDVYSIRRGVAHSGGFIDPEAYLLSVITPPRAEYPPESETSFWPNEGESRPEAMPPIDPDDEPTVRTLFNMRDVTDQLREIEPGRLYGRTWHIEGMSVSVTKVLRCTGEQLSTRIKSLDEEINFCLKGALRMHIGGQHDAFAEGQIMIIPPGVPHTGDCVTDESLFISLAVPHSAAFTPSRFAEVGQ